MALGFGEPLGNPLGGGPVIGSDDPEESSDNDGNPGTESSSDSPEGSSDNDSNVMDSSSSSLDRYKPDNDPRQDSNQDAPSPGRVSSRDSGSADQEKAPDEDVTESGGDDAERQATSGSIMSGGPSITQKDPDSDASGEPENGDGGPMWEPNTDVEKDGADMSRRKGDPRDDVPSPKQVKEGGKSAARVLVGLPPSGGGSSSDEKDNEDGPSVGTIVAGAAGIISAGAIIVGLMD